MKDTTLIKEWLVDDPMAIIHSAIEKVDSNIFEVLRIKKMLNKANDLFEPTKITIEQK
jgi:hypothetical protein